MSTKPKSNSVLKNLSAERQDQIAAWCRKANDVDPETGKPIPETGGIAWAQQQLAADGIKLTERPVREFFHWYCLRETFSQAEQATKDFEEFLIGQFPNATPEKLAAAGQLVFTMQAKNSGDAATFLAMEKLRLDKATAEHNAAMDKAKLDRKDRELNRKDVEFKLALEKFQFDAAEKVLANLAELRTIASSRTLSSDAKIQQVRLKLWGDAAGPEKTEGTA